MLSAATKQDYLVWKWRPDNQELNSTSKENAIRYGSTLHVKDGEMCVFVYKQKDQSLQDFITGPYEDTIKTANFPVLSSIVGQHLEALRLFLPKFISSICRATIR